MYEDGARSALHPQVNVSTKSTKIMLACSGRGVCDRAGVKGVPGTCEWRATALVRSHPPSEPSPHDYKNHLTPTLAPTLTLTLTAPGTCFPGFVHSNGRGLPGTRGDCGYLIPTWTRPTKNNPTGLDPPGRLVLPNIPGRRALGWGGGGGGGRGGGAKHQG